MEGTVNEVVRKVTVASFISSVFFLLQAEQ